MCLKITTHTLPCDVRPISRMSGSGCGFVVNPFAAPRKCACQKTNPVSSCSSSSPSSPDTTAPALLLPIPSRLSCPDHACCIATSRFIPCGCDDEVQYHQYVRSDFCGSGASSYSSIGPVDEYNSEKSEKSGNSIEDWRPVPSIDDHLASVLPAYYIAQASRELRIARRGLRYVANNLAPKTTELKLAADKLRAAEEWLEERLFLGHVDLAVSDMAHRKIRGLAGDLDRIRKEAVSLRTSLRCWKAAVKRMEVEEFGRQQAVEMIA